MVKPTLLVLAAGMGSRYGSLKQMDGVGPNNEAIIDYSVYDAIRAGFGKVVFVIRHSFEKEFREVFSAERFGGRIAVEFVFQELDYLPEGASVPEGRVKPWGTNHAVMMAADAVHEPFAVINADDFYGADAYRTIYAELQRLPKAGAAAMVGYLLKNTVTAHGTVSRGVCHVKDGYLSDIRETLKIALLRDGVIRDEDTGAVLDGDTVVSMNFWGFSPLYLRELARRFPAFLDENLPRNPLKCEYFLPLVVTELIEENKAKIQVLRSTDKWFGVTYREDKPLVVEAIARKTAEGQYPENLWA